MRAVKYDDSIDTARYEAIEIMGRNLSNASALTWPDIRALYAAFDALHPVRRRDHE